MAMATPTTLLPMWRSPTASSCSSTTHRSGVHTPWDDEAFAVAKTKSPTRIVQCLNFLAQVERLHVRETTYKRFRDPMYQVDVYLSDDENGDFGSSPHKPTYQIERSLAEFEQLRADVVHAMCRSSRCSYCKGFQKRFAAWEQHWPRRRLSRFFRFARASASENVMHTMVNDVLALSRSQLRVVGESCEAFHQIPATMTSFLVRHELSMDE